MVQARHLELRHADRADPARRERRRPPHPGRVPGDEAGVRLLVQPPDRRADLADSRSGRCRSRRCRARSCRRRSRIPTKPAPFEFQGRTRRAPDRLHAGDQEARARSARSERDAAGAALRAADASRQRRGQGPGATSVRAAAAARTSPARRRPIRRAGVIFITSTSGCSPTHARAGEGARQRQDDRQDARAVGHARAASVGAPPPKPARTIRCAGIPDLFKGPLGRISAIDMNTGEHLWMIPHGDMDARAAGGVPQQPAAEGRERRHQLGPPRPRRADGDARRCCSRPARPPTTSRTCSRIDKKTGKRVGAVPTPRHGQYGLMTYLHQGKQYVDPAGQRRLHGDGAAVGTRLAAPKLAPRAKAGARDSASYNYSILHGRPFQGRPFFLGTTPQPYRKPGTESGTISTCRSKSIDGRTTISTNRSAC